MVPDGNFTSKSSHTKVFSGIVKSRQEPSSNIRLTSNEAQKQLNALKRFTDVPFATVEPALCWVKPEQLKEIELVNPHFIEETGKLWENFVKKDFRGNQRKETETWREMYERCKGEKEEKLRRMTEAAKLRRVETSCEVEKVQIVDSKTSVQPSENHHHLATKANKSEVDSKPVQSKPAKEESSDTEPTSKAPRRAAAKSKSAPLMKKVFSQMKRR